MIRFIDATKLASTKLRTRKVRLVVTIVIAALMFSVLAAASQISRGAFSSLADFNREGFGDRYIAAAMPNYGGNVDPTTLPEVVARAEAIHKDLIAKKIAEAKRLGLTYDPKSETPATSEFDGPTGKMRGLDTNQAAGKQAMSEYYAAHPAPGLAELKKQASPYDPRAYYQSKGLAMNGAGPGLKILKAGKEDYTETQKGPEQQFQQRGLGSFTSSWGLMSQDLFKPFMLPGTNPDLGKDGSIPVIAPYSAVEQLLGYKELPEATKPAQRLERIKQVRDGAGNVTFQVCYRNQSSQELIGQAIAQQKEIADNKGKKDYLPPSLVYALPQVACGPAIVQTDKRNAAEKILAGKQEQFDRAFGEAEPVQQIMNFRVIGIAPDTPDFSASVVSTLVASIVSSNLSLFGPTWFTPIELEQTQPLIKSAFSSTDSTMLAGPGTAVQYVEFKSAQSAKDFRDKEICEPDFSMLAGPQTTDDPFAECTKQGKYFSFMPFGSNALALEEVKRGFSKVFTYAAIAVAIVAAIIMVGTVGRTIADSRRETAVFRAIGAKKIDIVLVYVIYTFFLSLLIFVAAVLIGFIVAQLVHGRYSDELTIQSLVAYNASDLSKSFNLYSFYAPDMAKLLGLSLAGGALSAFFPLLRNLRRNPIRDMRDEN